LRQYAINCRLNADTSWNAGRTSVRLHLEDVPMRLQMPTRYSQDDGEFCDLSKTGRTEIY